VGERGEAARRELLVELGDPEQPVLQARALLRARRPGDDLEPAIDLHRVAGDRHRVLAALA
jgi:hypothetical protein